MLIANIRIRQFVLATCTWWLPVVQEHREDAARSRAVVEDRYHAATHRALACSRSSHLWDADKVDGGVKTFRPNDEAIATDGVWRGKDFSTNLRSRRCANIHSIAFASQTYNCKKNHYCLLPNAEIPQDSFFGIRSSVTSQKY